MIRVVVAKYLETVTEREFDAPLLAVLASRGCTDIHFIHGSYEFGKDVIAKRVDPVTGVLHQLAIQSKAGDINQAAWRDVRPQLEECGYNTRAHPAFDVTLPRTAVLVTTGRLVGGAAVDAQEYKAVCTTRGLTNVEFWDDQTLLDWICVEPGLALAGTEVSNALMSLLSQIDDHAIGEPMVERYTRGWVGSKSKLSRAAVEASIVCNALRRTRRLDLAALTSLHLLRAAVAADRLGSRDMAEAAKSLFCGYGQELLNEIEPLLEDAHRLAEPVMTLGAAATYPAMCCRLTEIVALLALTADGSELAERAFRATQVLVDSHPGSTRPPSDAFAVSIVPVVCALGRRGRDSASDYLRLVARWLLDRHDDELGGLGLASLDESEEVTVERLLGGKLSGTTLERRRPSYLLAVVLDLFIVLGDQARYEAVRDQARALRIVPTMTYAHESESWWLRGGPAVWPQPNIPYGDWGAMPVHHAVSIEVAAIDAVLMAAVCRSRHNVNAIAEVLSNNPEAGR
ncbi:MAG: hypothetical protein WAQ75_02240 [Propionicimonas sp.]